MEMTQEWITQYNKKCAEFVGEEITTYFVESQMDLIGSNALQFHSDWNWIMEVVEKIESLGLNFKINTQWNPFNECNYTQVSVNKVIGEMSKDRKCMYNSVNVYEKNSDNLRSKKKAVIQSIDQFIDWYNKQKEL